MPTDTCDSTQLTGSRVLDRRGDTTALPAAVAAACRPGFDGQHLRQVQATALITQGAWQRVLEKNGFTAPSRRTPGGRPLTFTTRLHHR